MGILFGKPQEQSVERIFVRSELEPQPRRLPTWDPPVEGLGYVKPITRKRSKSKLSSRPGRSRYMPSYVHPDPFAGLGNEGRNATLSWR